MSNLLKGIACVVAAFGLTVLAVSAQEKGKSAKSRILHPEMTVEGGSYSAPMGKLGDKGEQPWSSTTLGASVEGKPNTGATRTVVGEIVDFSCYLEVGKHGEKHRDCAQKCFRAGQPIGLLAKDGSIYLLMEEEHNPRRDGLTNLREKAIDLAGNVVEVKGTASKVDNQKALFVTGLVKQ